MDVILFLRFSYKGVEKIQTIIAKAQGLNFTIFIFLYFYVLPIYFIIKTTH